jgi:flavin reductase (DIM6/NTAB) family NADH-FMN oxidoreductase RutF
MSERFADIDPVLTALQELRRGFYVIGFHAGDDVSLMTADSVMQVSLVPLLVAVPIKNEAETLRHLQESGTLTVNVLADDPTESAFGSSGPQNEERFELGEHTGCPILREATAWFECRVRMTVPVGDHTLVVSRVIDGGLRRIGSR